MACLVNVLVAIVLSCTIIVDASHAWYEFDASASSTTFEAMSSTQIWDRVEHTAQSYVYGAMQFYFENGVVGYFGGQHHGLGQTIVDFAIWDSSNISKSSQAMPVPGCGRFGGEGTGSHCEQDVDLLKGREYSYHIELSMRNASGSAWTASVVDEYTGNETVIGTLFVHTDPAHPPPAGSKISGYGGLTAGMTSPRKTVPKKEPVDPDSYGGISFMEYYLGGSFYSSFGWIGPRFFPTSTAFGGVGKALRLSRGPTCTEQGVVLPQRIMVDSESGADKSIMNGCIPGYECGGDRVFFQGGPTLQSQPPAGTFAWIYNGTIDRAATVI